jgi:peptide/nickel transport system substrate-binding protein
LVEWKPKESITLKAFPGYFEGSPEIETLIIRWVPGAAPQLADLKSGAASFIGLFATTPPDEFDGLKNTYQTFQFPAFTVHEVQLDLTKPMFADKRVRQAMMYAMDREAIAQKLWDGKARVPHSAVHPLNWAYAEPKTTYRYDLAKAKQLLAEAGWTPGPDGVVQKDGQPLSFTIHAQRGHPEKTAIAVQEFLKSAGIDAKVEATEVNRIITEIRFAGKFEGIASHFVSSLFSDPTDMVSRYWSKAGDQANFMTYASPRFDQVYLASLQTTDTDKRKQSMAELNEIMSDELPVLPIVWLDDLFVLDKKVTIPEGIDSGYQFMASIPRWKLKS